MAASSSLSGVANRYAGALFDLCTDDAKLVATEKDLNSFDAALQDSEDLMRLVKSPVFTVDDQLKALNALLAKSEMSEMTANFLRVVTKNRRLFALPAMVDAFRRLAANARGEMSAEVTSAVSLNATQVKDLQAALKAQIGKDVVLKEIVDPTILGGLKVKVGSKMIDTSIQTKLNSLKTMMKEVG